MLKRYIWLAVVTVFFVCSLFVGTAAAAELDAETRTIPLNDQGDTITLSLEQVVKGRRLFSDSCAVCHLAGGTKTNPNVSLSSEDLAGAFPPRDNLEALIDFIKNPTTYDGLEEIAEVHPSTKSSDIFPKMRNLTDDDLVALAGHILLQPKVVGEMWGGGKSRN